MHTQSSKLELNQEYPGSGEASAIQAIERMIVEKLEQTHKELEQDNQTGENLVRRDAHAKHHGCVRAEFIVEPDLPEEMQFGVFKQPGNRFTACIRFSNGSGNANQPDSKGDGRGMAIKLLGVEGEKLLTDEKATQDFVMINHPVFLIRNLQDYVEFTTVVQQSKDKPPFKFFFPSWNPFKWRLHEFTIARSIQNSKIANPLEVQYWSMTPYRLGNRAIKFSAKPSHSDRANRSVSSSENYLREAMINHLSNKEASFDFLIQFQTDAEQMPIEDPTVEWKSPFYKVATIKIPPQKFDFPEQMRFCENLSYTPWHSLADHQPLGGINRARKQIYTSISQLRHSLNGVPQQEPTEEELLAFSEVVSQKW